MTIKVLRLLRDHKYSSMRLFEVELGCCGAVVEKTGGSVKDWQEGRHSKCRSCARREVHDPRSTDACHPAPLSPLERETARLLEIATSAMRGIKVKLPDHGGDVGSANPWQAAVIGRERALENQKIDKALTPWWLQ